MAETRQQMIDRLIDDNRRKREKPKMSQTPPGYVAIKHLIGEVVRFKPGDFFTPGVVTNIGINPGGVVYHVTWSDTRQSSPHYDFELEAVEAD